MGRRSFTEVLDEKLREIPHPTTAALPIAPAVRTMPVHPLLFATAYRPLKPAGFAEYDGCAAAFQRSEFADVDDHHLYASVGRGHARFGDGHQTSSPRIEQAAAPRQLTASENDALTTLNRLGARLESNFTPEGLRTAYRALARRLHPDHHAHTDPVEQTRRSRLFVVATAHHRTLQQVFARETQIITAGA